MTDDSWDGSYVTRDKVAEEAVAVIRSSAWPKLRLLIVRCKGGTSLQKSSKPRSAQSFSPGRPRSKVELTTSQMDGRTTSFTTGMDRTCGAPDWTGQGTRQPSPISPATAAVAWRRCPVLGSGTRSRLRESVSFGVANRPLY
jgi:hypothetical protein